METVIDVEKGRARGRGDGMEVEENVKTEAVSPLKAETKTPAPLSSRPPPRRKDSAIAQEILHSQNGSLVGGIVARGNTLPCNVPGLHSLYRRHESVTRSLAPAMPKGELVELKPRLLPSATVVPEHKKIKPPKFIPFEPYPGAVNPIIPKPSNGTAVAKSIRINKNNLDIGVLVNQMSTMRTQEMGDEKIITETKAADTHLKDYEIQQLQDELLKIKEERDYYQGQFKFQTQVNSELKNLLVASVGEDLQTRVNVLTEDKLQLARALLDTANNLTTHTEQIEFLAGQCEVWRSKFLASSVMVEELARWKADLTQKNQMLTEGTKRLMHSMHEIREMQLEILKNLKFLAKIRYLNLPATDVINLSAENLNILQQMVLHSGVGIPEANLKQISSANSNPLCEAESYAMQALEFISQPLIATDEAIRALFGQAQKPYGNIDAGATVANVNQPAIV